MKVILRHPKRQELELSGRRRVDKILADLGLHPDTVLVISGATLLTRDAMVEEDQTIEVRPVISGGTSALSEV